MRHVVLPLALIALFEIAELPTFDWRAATTTIQLANFLQTVTNCSNVAKKLKTTDYHEKTARI